MGRLCCLEGLCQRFPTCGEEVVVVVVVTRYAFGNASGLADGGNRIVCLPPPDVHDEVGGHERSQRRRLLRPQSQYHADRCPILPQALHVSYAVQIPRFQGEAAVWRGDRC
jgi:hypothetical protein